MTKVIEVNSEIQCRETILNNIDFRSRPISKDIVSMIKQDLQGINTGF